jgi:hypothetical protein
MFCGESNVALRRDQPAEGGSIPTSPLHALRVAPISRREAVRLVIAHHYMHRKPPVSHAFGLVDAAGQTLGVVTFGTPASHHMLIGACKSAPQKVLELNRLWVHDCLPRNTESWFLRRALMMMPPRIILSYADTAAGHVGYVYRAANFHYAGWTDMERKTPRFDYVAPGKHSRDAFRNGWTDKVRRKPKVKYWIVTGKKADRETLTGLCAWPRMSWKELPPPLEHRQAA